MWVPKPGPINDAVAAAVGLRRGRDLVQMRRELPVTEQSAAMSVRPFRTGEDELAWLEVNNRAFRDHPEQGSWDLATITEREHQPWFDPRGFLLHERDGRLAGFCWTKVHEPENDLMNEVLMHHLGEIYVIAVDPDFQGHGLGRQLVLAGLASLSERGSAPGCSMSTTTTRRLAISTFLSGSSTTTLIVPTSPTCRPAEPVRRPSGRRK